jgi:hypothetical protein
LRPPDRKNVVVAGAVVTETSEIVAVLVVESTALLKE